MNDPCHFVKDRLIQRGAPEYLIDLYYKYFEQDLAPVPGEKLAVLGAGP